MSIALINCPACARAVSAAAPSCVQYGHPMRSVPRKRNIGYLFVAGVLAVVGVAGYKLDLHTTWLDSAPSATDVRYVQVSQQLPQLSSRELALELQQYTLRANRTLPRKPNPMLTLERIHYKPKPNRLVYDYEVNVTTAFANVDLTLVRPALMNRYCNHDDFALASANEVEVSFRYLKTGRVIHQETIGGCDLMTVSAS
ncbi:hypothetical protein N9Y37_05650 [Luminiphilus sp.]|nr:hypothetical protein [Luminiphilus sp.]